MRLRLGLRPGLAWGAYSAPLTPYLWPDLQNILRQSYDYLTIMPTLRSTYDGRLICKTSYEECKAYVQFTCKIVRSYKIVFVN